MKKNKGFISVAIIYSFFLIFLSMMMFIILNNVNNRILINNMEIAIKKDIRDSSFTNYLLNRKDELKLKKINNSYRYIGKNPNNYIIFCNEVYRIIGVIDGKVKIIKDTALNNKAWNIKNDNYYATSSVYNFLNVQFKNSLGTYDKYVQYNTWYIGGLDSSYKEKDSNVIAENELNNKGSVVNNYIALPYISDYIYAYDEIEDVNNNWLFTEDMWFITKNTSNNISSYYLKADGNIDCTDLVSVPKKIKPTFFLRNSVKYVSGSGTSNDPYIVNISGTAGVLDENENTELTLANYIKSKYTYQGSNGLYHHDGTLENGINDDSYRYAGASDKVNNFVCFGTDKSPCPTDNLYRIIGVIDGKVKLIKYDYATSNLLGADGDYTTSTYSNGINRYTWNYKNNTTINFGKGSNTWSTSLLNKTNLNQNFITKIGTEWADKIAMTTWKVGGNTRSNIETQPAKTAYQNEIVSPVTTNATDNATTYSAKVGLMYASDYGFAAAPSAWTSTIYDYYVEDITSVNWMYMGLYEWTLSRDADYDCRVFTVGSLGGVSNVLAGSAFVVRPVFYLTSYITYKSGTGTKTDPIRIN